jgi:hypothetical protein
LTASTSFPPKLHATLEVFRIHGPKSNVTIPLVTNGRVFGALAFASLAAERKWREDEIAELKLVAQIIGNVVARQRAELREEQLRDQLAHAMRVASLGELVAALAHELNQPLAAILSNAQAARRFLGSGTIDVAELQAILDDIVRDDKRAGKRDSQSARHGQQTARPSRTVLLQRTGERSHRTDAWRGDRGTDRGAFLARIQPAESARGSCRVAAGAGKPFGQCGAFDEGHAAGKTESSTSKPAPNQNSP